MRLYWLWCHVIGSLRQIYSVEICGTISWLLAIDVSTLSAISGYCHRRKSSALGSQSASCTFVLIFALCLFAGFKRAYVFCYAKECRVQIFAPKFQKWLCRNNQTNRNNQINWMIEAITEFEVRNNGEKIVRYKSVFVQFEPTKITILPTARI
jgi:hypothetical protein